MEGSHLHTSLPRSAPKSKSAQSLKKLSEDAIIKILLNSKLCNDQNSSRIINENLPRELKRSIVDRCLDRWMGVGPILKLLRIFDVKSVLADSELDLLGAFRYFYGGLLGERTQWVYSSITHFSLDTIQCIQLFNYLQDWRIRREPKPIYLRSLALSTKDHTVLGDSNMTSIIARSHTLTRVTIINGATNHILRILGLNCPSLTLVDISYSEKVNDTGIKGLLMKSPRQRTTPPITNDCARSIKRIITVGTNISSSGLNMACKLLDKGYSVSFRPDSLIFRQNAKSFNQSIEMSSSSPLAKLNCSLQLQSELETTVTRFSHGDGGPATENEPQIVDFYGSLEKGIMFVRPGNSFIAQSVVGIETSRVTELTLTWHNIKWHITSLPDLTELAVSLPALRKLKTRIRGSWDRSQPLFPLLEDVFIWTVGYASAISFLQWAPNIKLFKCSSVCLESSDDVLLDHDGLVNCFTGNPSLRNTIEEMSIEPAPNLTSHSVEFLLGNCSKLKRLGELSSWRVSERVFQNLNRLLDTRNSNCMLTFLSFPPKKETGYLL